MKSTTIMLVTALALAFVPTASFASPGKKPAQSNACTEDCRYMAYA